MSPSHILNYLALTFGSLNHSRGINFVGNDALNQYRKWLLAAVVKWTFAQP